MVVVILQSIFVGVVLLGLGTSISRIRRGFSSALRTSALTTAWAALVTVWGALVSFAKSSWTWIRNNWRLFIVLLLLAILLAIPPIVAVVTTANVPGETGVSKRYTSQWDIFEIEVLRPTFDRVIGGTARALVIPYEAIVPWSNALTGSVRIFRRAIGITMLECPLFSLAEVLEDLAESFPEIFGALYDWTLSFFVSRIELVPALVYVQAAGDEFIGLVRCGCEAMSAPADLFGVLTNNYTAVLFDTVFNQFVRYLDYPLVFVRELVYAIVDWVVGGFTHAIANWYYTPYRGINVTSIIEETGDSLAAAGGAVDVTFGLIIENFIGIPRTFWPKIFLAIGQQADVAITFFNAIFTGFLRYFIRTIVIINVDNARVDPVFTARREAIWAGPLTLLDQFSQEAVDASNTIKDAGRDIGEPLYNLCTEEDDALGHCNVVTRTSSLLGNYTIATADIFATGLVLWWHSWELAARPLFNLPIITFGEKQWDDILVPYVTQLVDDASAFWNSILNFVDLFSDPIKQLLQENGHIVRAITDFSRAWIQHVRDHEGGDWIRGELAVPLNQTFEYYVNLIFFEIDATFTSAGNAIRALALTGDGGLLMKTALPKRRPGTDYSPGFLSEHYERRWSSLPTSARMWSFDAKGRKKAADPYPACAARIPHDANSPAYPVLQFPGWNETYEAPDMSLVDPFCCLGNMVEELGILLAGVARTIARVAAAVPQFRTGPWLDHYLGGPSLDNKKNMRATIVYLLDTALNVSLRAQPLLDAALRDGSPFCGWLSIPEVILQVFYPDLEDFCIDSGMATPWSMMRKVLELITIGFRSLLNFLLNIGGLVVRVVRAFLSYDFPGQNPLNDFLTDPQFRASTYRRVYLTTVGVLFEPLRNYLNVATDCVDGLSDTGFIADFIRFFTGKDLDGEWVTASPDPYACSIWDPVPRSFDNIPDLICEFVYYFNLVRDFIASLVDGTWFELIRERVLEFVEDVWLCVQIVIIEIGNNLKNTPCLLLNSLSVNFASACPACPESWNLFTWMRDHWVYGNSILAITRIYDASMWILPISVPTGVHPECYWLISPARFRYTRALASSSSYGDRCAPPTGIIPFFCFRIAIRDQRLIPENFTGNECPDAYAECPDCYFSSAWNTCCFNRYNAIYEGIAKRLGAGNFSELIQRYTLSMEHFEDGSLLSVSVNQTWCYKEWSALDALITVANQEAEQSPVMSVLLKQRLQDATDALYACGFSVSTASLLDQSLLMLNPYDDYNQSEFVHDPSNYLVHPRVFYDYMARTQVLFDLFFNFLPTLAQALGENRPALDVALERNASRLVQALASGADLLADVFTERSPDKSAWIAQYLRVLFGYEQPVNKARQQALKAYLLQKRGSRRKAAVHPLYAAAIRNSVKSGLNAYATGLREVAHRRGHNPPNRALSISRVVDNVKLVGGRRWNWLDGGKIGPEPYPAGTSREREIWEQGFLDEIQLLRAGDVRGANIVREWRERTYPAIERDRFLIEDSFFSSSSSGQNESDYEIVVADEPPNIPIGKRLPGKFFANSSLRVQGRILRNMPVAFSAKGLHDLSLQRRKGALECFDADSPFGFTGDCIERKIEDLFCPATLSSVTRTTSYCEERTVYDALGNPNEHLRCVRNTAPLDLSMRCSAVANTAADAESAWCIEALLDGTVIVSPADPELGLNAPGLIGNGGEWGAQSLVCPDGSYYVAGMNESEAFAFANRAYAYRCCGYDSGSLFLGECPFVMAGFQTVQGDLSCSFLPNIIGRCCLDGGCSMRAESDCQGGSWQNFTNCALPNDADASCGFCESPVCLNCDFVSNFINDFVTLWYETGREAATKYGDAKGACCLSNGTCIADVGRRECRRAANRKTYVDGVGLVRERPNEDPLTFSWRFGEDCATCPRRWGGLLSDYERQDPEYLRLSDWDRLMNDSRTWMQETGARWRGFSNVTGTPLHPIAPLDLEDDPELSALLDWFSGRVAFFTGNRAFDIRVGLGVIVHFFNLSAPVSDPRTLKYFAFNAFICDPINQSRCSRPPWGLGLRAGVVVSIIITTLLGWLLRRLPVGPGVLGSCMTVLIGALPILFFIYLTFFLSYGISPFCLRPALPARVVGVRVTGVTNAAARYATAIGNKAKRSVAEQGYKEAFANARKGAACILERLPGGKYICRAAQVINLSPVLVDCFARDLADWGSIRSPCDQTRCKIACPWHNGTWPAGWDPPLPALACNGSSTTVQCFEEGTDCAPIGGEGTCLPIYPSSDPDCCETAPCPLPFDSDLTMDSRSLSLLHADYEPRFFPDCKKTNLTTISNAVAFLLLRWTSSSSAESGRISSVLLDSQPGLLAKEVIAPYTDDTLSSWSSGGVQDERLAYCARRTLIRKSWIIVPVLLLLLLAGLPLLLYLALMGGALILSGFKYVGAELYSSTEGESSALGPEEKDSTTTQRSTRE